MKVYACPEHLPAPELDLTKPLDFEAHRAREAEHQESVKAWLVGQGHRGERTGEVALFTAADGYARYMLADGGPGRKSFLVWLPYGDAYQYPDVVYLPKAAVIKKLDQQKGIAELFPGPAAAA